MLKSAEKIMLSTLKECNNIDISDKVILGIYKLINS